jgi:LuxR family maltose regulon positive regulatory protein
VDEVETSLLTTKLNIPPAHTPLVKRPRLFNRLHEGLKYNLILVSAPAGFGKTTLLSEWARQGLPSVRTAWVSLDEGDNDPIRFCDYLVAALRTLQPAAGEKALTLLHSPQMPSGQTSSIEPALMLLINELAATPGDLIVVLDDYHLIESLQIHSGITYLLEHLPMQIHLVISTRADPPLTLARFRGRGAMLEIGSDDLRFTQDEAASFLKEMTAPKLPPEDVAALQERTEGWAVGLKMAALSLQKQKDIHGFITAFTGSHRYVMDYLIEEVLQKQTMEIRDFLLKTSVLERLSGPLCDAVTGRQDSSNILPALERGHLFIIPLDEIRRWYRYEHLFTDLLRHQMKKTFEEKDIAELHRRASRWYETNHLPDNAITHAIAARDWERAAGIIEDTVRARINRGEWITIRGWLRSLPENVLKNHLSLYSRYCFALAINGQLDEAESKLRKMEMISHGDARIRGAIAATQALIYNLLDDIPRTAKFARKALSLLPPDEIESRSVACYTLGNMYWYKGFFTKAKPLITEANNGARQVGNLGVIASSLLLLAEIDRYGGKLHRAAEQLQEAIELTGTSPASSPAHFSWGALLGEWNRLEEAVEQMQKAVELGQIGTNREFVARAYFLLAYLRSVQGDETGTSKALEQSCSIAHKLTAPRARADHAAFHVMLALMQDDLDTASEWGKRLAPDVDALPFYINLIPSRLLIAQGKKAAAAERLRAMYEETMRGGQQSYTIRLRMYQALAAEDEDTALDFLADSLRMAEPEGYIRTFVDEGKLLAPLLERVIADGITPEYAARLLDIIQKEQQLNLAAEKAKLLSRRELEVLRLLAEGLANRQICQRLALSPNTAKTHIRHILEKLDSQSRLQAVARARELELIS